MSVRELKLCVKRREYNKKVLKDAEYLSMMLGLRSVLKRIEC